MVRRLRGDSREFPAAKRRTEKEKKIEKKKIVFFDRCLMGVGGDSVVLGACFLFLTHFSSFIFFLSRSFLSSRVGEGR